MEQRDGVGLAQERVGGTHGLSAARFRAMMLCAATASASASREDASQSCMQIWCAAACRLSVRAAIEVAVANDPEIAIVRSDSKPAPRIHFRTSQRFLFGPRLASFRPYYHPGDEFLRHGPTPFRIASVSPEAFSTPLFPFPTFVVC